MTEDFPSLVKLKLGLFLRRHGFVLVQEGVEPDQFGNSLVDFRSADMRLRLVRDRGQVFAEVGGLTRPDEWHDLTAILGFTGAEYVPEDHSESYLEQLSSVLQTNYSMIQTALSEEQYPALQRFKRAQAAERFGL